MLYMAFVDLEKAFDRVPRKVIWWALRKLGVEEWIVQLVQGMYANAGGPKDFSLWNYFTGGSSNSVAPESASPLRLMPCSQKIKGGRV